MVEATNEYLPDYLVTPGEVLGYELELRGMNQQELSKRTGVTPKHIISILKAKSAITPEMAIRLERALGMPVEYWLNLESNYQENLARKAEEEQLENDQVWLKKIPVKEISKLGWIEKYKDKKEQLVEVLRFFGIASVEQWKNLWPNLNVAYRQHKNCEIFPEAISAWLRMGEIEASGISCQPYDKVKFREALNEVRGLTLTTPDVFVPAMQELCAEAGVAVVFIPSIPKTSISGATRWINKDKAIIQLSLRYKTDDHLWFTFFHEAGHILLHGKKELFLENVGGMSNDKEVEANQFSENELIPQKKIREFIAGADFSERSVIAFSKAIGISPGVVVGQLQHKQLLDIKYLNKLKIRFKWEHE